MESVWFVYEGELIERDVEDGRVVTSTPKGWYYHPGVERVNSHPDAMRSRRVWTNDAPMDMAFHTYDEAFEHMCDVRKRMGYR